MKRKLVGLLYLVSLLTTLLLVAAPVMAGVTYNYTGNPYNFFSNQDASLGTNLTASFTFDSSVVTNNYTGYEYFPASYNDPSFNNIISWSATSGAITLSSLNHDTEVGAMFEFNNGAIVTWYFAVGSNPGYYIASYNYVSIYDVGANYYVNQNNISQSTRYGSDYGTWAKQGSSNQVPEPATLLLFGLGLMGIAGIKRRFKK